MDIGHQRSLVAKANALPLDKAGGGILFLLAGRDRSVARCVAPGGGST
jgi:hypothetical protein